MANINPGPANGGRTDTLVVTGGTAGVTIDGGGVGTTITNGSLVLDDHLYVDHINMELATTSAAGSKSAGSATLNPAGGMLTVNTTAVAADSLIFLTHADATGAGAIYYANVVPGVSFQVKSTAGGGSSDKFNWLIINPYNE